MKQKNQTTKNQNPKQESDVTKWHDWPQQEPQNINWMNRKVMIIWALTHWPWARLKRLLISQKCCIRKITKSMFEHKNRILVPCTVYSVIYILFGYTSAQLVTEFLCNKPHEATLSNILIFGWASIDLLLLSIQVSVQTRSPSSTQTFHF